MFLLLTPFAENRKVSFHGIAVESQWFEHGSENMFGRLSKYLTPPEGLTALADPVHPAPEVSLHLLDS